MFFDPNPVPLDQSKAPPPSPPLPSDMELRITALRFAMTAHAGPKGDPDDVIDTTRDFYLFLICEDPVIDSQWSNEEPTAEVIPFRVARKDYEDGD